MIISFPFYSLQAPILDTPPQISFTKGLDQSVALLDPLDSTLSVFTLSSTIEHAYVALFNARDGSQERIVMSSTFSHPSLSFGETQLSQGESQAVYFRGTSSADVYLNALRSLNYTNDMGSPTTGERLVVMVVSDGIATNSISSAAVNLSVGIDNSVPSIFVGSGLESYLNTFFPDGGPVSAVNPSEARIVDTDSRQIYEVTLQLSNVRNQGDENLTVTYVSPDRLSLPVVAEATPFEMPLLDVPFGNLSARSELVRSTSNTILVSDVGVVGNVIVIVDIRHSWIGDLKLELEHADRTETLVLNPGGKLCARDDLFQAVFDASTPANVSLSKTSTSPGLCTFQAQGVFSPDGNLASFRGDPMEGAWHLHVTDLLLSNDNGRLVTWGLVIQPEESHALVSHPPVVPPLVVMDGGSLYEQHHVREVSEVGRITRISVQVHLGVVSTATVPYLPQINLHHPDGTVVLLTDSSVPLCALGNFTYLIFDDRAADGRSYTCQEALDRERSASSNSGSADASPTVASSPSSGSGSGPAATTYEDIISMNISIPVKSSIVDVLRPQMQLASLHGKTAAGKWTLHLSTPHTLPSTLLGWSLRFSREPNIDSTFDYSGNALYLQGADSAENYEKVLRSVVYDNVAPIPDFSVERRVQTTAFDGEGYSLGITPSALSQLTVHHIDLDLDPNNISGAATPGFRVTFQEHGSSIPILDPENALLRDAVFSSGQYTLTVQLFGYQNQNEEMLIWNGDVAPELINTTVIDDVAELFEVTITSSPGDLQPIESFQDVLRTFEYVNEAEEFSGTGRRVEVFVSDSQMSSNYISVVAVSTISFQPTNDLPVLVLNSYGYSETDMLSNMVEFTEGEGPVYLANDSAIVLTDNDHDYLSSLTVIITNPQDGASEILSAVVDGTSISQSYDNQTNTLSLTGVDTLDNYIIVIATIAYDNTVHSPGKPGTTPRNISFTPSDGSHDGRNAVVRVSFTAVNDPPMADLNGPMLGTGTTVTFVEEGNPVTVFPNVSFFDIDTISLSYVEVQITNLFNAPLEILAVTDVVQQTDPDQKFVTVTNLRPVSDYNYTTGTLTVSGLDSIPEYELVLRTLTYVNLADEPGQTPRIIRVTLSDRFSVSDPVYATVLIEPVNDSPFFITSASSPITVRLEEDMSHSGNSEIDVSSLVEVLSDDDVNATIGIVVVGLDLRNGIWEFNTDGRMWNEILMEVSRVNGLALDLESVVRFIPNPHFYGVASFSFVGWDQTDVGSQVGTYIDARSESNTDAFSSGSRTVDVIINGVNDAPTLLEVPLNATTILEDDRNSTGDTVASLLNYASDIDDPSRLGVAIVDADQANGRWEFTNDGGVTWEEFGRVSQMSALLLWSLPASSRRVRFVPNPDYNGMASFRFLAWDLTTLAEDRSQVATSDMEVSVVIASGSGLGSGSGQQSGSGSGQQSGSGSGFQTSNDSLHGTNMSNQSGFSVYPSGSRFINTSASGVITGPFSVNSTTLTIVIEP